MLSALKLLIKYNGIIGYTYVRLTLCSYNVKYFALIKLKNRANLRKSLGIISF